MKITAAHVEIADPGRRVDPGRWPGILMLVTTLLAAGGETRTITSAGPFQLPAPGFEPYRAIWALTVATIDVVALQAYLSRVGAAYPDLHITWAEYEPRPILATSTAAPVTPPGPGA